jgi:sensor histidine kinase YesM
LLENAFKHGVDSLSENAFIHIKLSVENEHILFEISNNFEANNDTSHGIGLENLKRRLQLLYKESYNLQMECKANIYKATLKLPVYA